MNFLSALARLQRRRAAQKTNKAENLVLRRQYATSTPDAMLESLDEPDRKALKNLFDATRSLAVPFNDGNTNIRGQLPCLQSLIARRKLNRLGLPEEIEPRAAEFLDGFITKGMEGKNAAPAKKS
jgi:hypothetical protein